MPDFLKDFFYRIGDSSVFRLLPGRIILFSFIFLSAGCGEKLYTGKGWCIEKSECGKAGLNCISAVKTFNSKESSAADQLLAFCATRETSCRAWCSQHCSYAKGSWCFTEKYHLIPK